MHLDLLKTHLSKYISLHPGEFDSFASLKVLVVGAGEMGKEVAGLLKKKGVYEVVMANRSIDWRADLHDCDILLFATNANEILLRAGELQREKPLFVIDLSTPRNVDPEVSKQEQVFLYNIDDLALVEARNRAMRQGEAAKAEKMLESCVEEAMNLFSPSQVEETIASLHAKWEEIRQIELERTFARNPEWTKEQKEAVDVMTRAIVKRMMHDPLVSLKALQQAEDSPGILQFLRRLFALESA